MRSGSHLALVVEWRGLGSHWMRALRCQLRAMVVGDGVHGNRCESFLGGGVVCL